MVRTEKFSIGDIEIGSEVAVEEPVEEPVVEEQPAAQPQPLGEYCQTCGHARVRHDFTKAGSRSGCSLCVCDRYVGPFITGDAVPTFRG